MSLINGDKARDNNRRRHRLKLRERGRELRKQLAEKAEHQKRAVSPAPAKKAG